MSTLVPRGQQAMNLPAKPGWSFTFDVPAELRLMIYEAAFDPVRPIHIKLREKNGQSRLRWAHYTHSRVPRNIMNVLLTSRQMYLEVIPFLYRQLFSFSPGLSRPMSSLNSAVSWMVGIGEHMRCLTHVRIILDYSTVCGVDLLPLLKVAWKHPSLDVEFRTDASTREADYDFNEDYTPGLTQSYANNIFTALRNKSHQVSKYGGLLKAVNIDFCSPKSHVEWLSANKVDRYTQRLSINSAGMVTIGQTNMSSQLKDRNFPMSVKKKIFGHVLQTGQAFEANGHVRSRSMGPGCPRLDSGLFHSSRHFFSVARPLFYEQVFDFTLIANDLGAVNYTPFTEWLTKFRNRRGPCRWRIIAGGKVTLRITFNLPSSTTTDKIHVNITPLLKYTQSTVTAQRHRRQEIPHAFAICFGMMTLPKTHPQYTEELVKFSLQTARFYNNVYEKLKIYTKGARGESHHPCPDIFVDKRGNVVEVRKHLAMASAQSVGDDYTFKEMKTHLSCWVRKLRDRRYEDKF